MVLTEFSTRTTSRCDINKRLLIKVYPLFTHYLFMSKIVWPSVWIIAVGNQLFADQNSLNDRSILFFADVMTEQIKLITMFLICFI